MNGSKYVSKSPVIKALKMHIFKNEFLRKSFDFTYKSQKYTLEEMLENIMYVNKTGIDWRSTRPIKSNIHWNTIYKAFIKLSKYEIFNISYSGLLKKYFKKTPAKKLKLLITDTSFIQNKNGKDLIEYNKFYSRKICEATGTKISIITDANGIVLNANLYSGNQNDAVILSDQLKTDFIIQPHILDHYKHYFLADKGYDSAQIRKTIKEMKMVPLIAQNKRNIKNKELLVKLDPIEKKIYKRRYIVEHKFKDLKSYKRLNLRYDSYGKTYMSFVYLALFNDLFKKK